MGVNEKTLSEPEIELEFEVGDTKEYEVKAIINSILYNKQANDQMPSLYYLIL